MKHNKVKNNIKSFEEDREFLEQISAAIDGEDFFPLQSLDMNNLEKAYIYNFWQVSALSSYTLKNSSYIPAKSNLLEIMNALEVEPAINIKSNKTLKYYLFNFVTRNKHNFLFINQIKNWINIAVPTLIIASFLSITILSEHNNVNSLQAQSANINSEKYIKTYQNRDDFMNIASSSEEENYIDSSIVANLY